jgi:hypothetical protein
MEGKGWGENVRGGKGGPEASRGEGTSRDVEGVRGVKWSGEVNTIQRGVKAEGAGAGAGVRVRGRPGARVRGRPGARVRGCAGGGMDGWMGGWGRACVGASVRGCEGAWEHGSMGAWVHGCMGALPHAYRHRWVRPRGHSREDVQRNGSPPRFGKSLKIYRIDGNRDLESLRDPRPMPFHLHDSSAAMPIERVILARGRHPPDGADKCGECGSAGGSAGVRV